MLCSVIVLFIGTDEKSQQISTVLESPDVGSKLSSDNFVAIKVEADSVPHQQFSALCILLNYYNKWTLYWYILNITADKQTPVPSIYFIGKNGLPLKIVTEATDSGTLTKELDDVLVKSGIDPSNITGLCFP